MEGNIAPAGKEHETGIPDAMREVVVGGAGGIAQVLIGRLIVQRIDAILKSIDV